MEAPKRRKCSYCRNPTKGEELADVLTPSGKRHRVCRRCRRFVSVPSAGEMLGNYRVLKRIPCGSE